MKKRMLTVLVLVVCTLLLSASAFAAVKCANTTGSSGCYVSINGAIGAASAGDIVMVWPGVYDENVDAYKNNLTIMGGTSPYAPAAPGTVVVDGYNGAGDGFSITGNNVTVKSLTVRHSQGSNFYITGNYAKLDTVRSIGGQYYGIYIDGSSGNGAYSATVMNSYIFGAYYDAIDINGAQATLIQKNTIMNIDDYGIDAYNNGTTNPNNLKIIQNVITGADSECIEIYGESNTNTVQNVTITGNTITNCSDEGIYLEYATKAAISGNTVMNTYYEGIYVDYVYSSKVDHNNISATTDDYCLESYSDYTDASKANTYTSNNCTDAYEGIYIDENNPIVTYNTVKNVGGGDNGITVSCSGTCLNGVIAYNSVTNVSDSYDCFDLSVSGMSIQNNTATSCQGYGYDISGDNNIITNNISKYNGEGDDYSGFYLSGAGNTLSGNTATYSGYFGFEIYSTGAANTLTGNTAQYNTWAGIYINNTGGAGHTTVQSNQVLNNDGEGIVNNDDAGNTIMNKNTSKGNRLDICNDDSGTNFASFLGNIFVTGGQNTACVLN